MKTNKSPLLKILILVFSVLGIIIIGYSLSDNYSKLQSYDWNISTTNIIISILIIQMRLLMRSFVFTSLLNVNLFNKFGLIKILFSYSLSQIVKYIPIKGFGIITQSLHLTGEAITKSLWVAHAMHYLLMLYNSSIILFTIFGCYYLGLPILGFLAIPLSFTTLLLIRYQLINKIFIFVVQLFKFKVQQPRNKLNAPKILFFLNAEWFFYCLCWVFLAPPEFTLFKAIQFGLLYELAALVGAFLFILPSGIIVREATFIVLGVSLGFSEEILLIFSIVLRLVFTFSEIIFCAINYLYFHITKTHKSVP